jgi:hypothetical protein
MDHLAAKRLLSAHHDDDGDAKELEGGDRYNCARESVGIPAFISSANCECATGP